MCEKEIKLNSNQIWPLLNILNEVCYGVFIEDFEFIIGTNKKNVIDLMVLIEKEENNEECLIYLNGLQLMIIDKSFDEIFKQIEEWEFQSRIGISREDAKKIKNIFQQ